MAMFTIHQKNTHVPYTIQIRDGETNEYRTHAFAFARKCDALKMSRMIEAHYNKHQTWPCNDVSEDSKMHVDASNLRELYIQRIPLKELYVRTWTEDNLVDYISDLTMHILMFNKFSKGDVQMQYYLFEYTQEFLKQRFQQNLRLD